MEKQEQIHKIGVVTYVVDRVFNGTRTPQDLVAEEIITSAKQKINFDHSTPQ